MIGGCLETWVLVMVLNTPGGAPAQVIRRYESQGACHNAALQAMQTNPNYLSLKCIAGPELDLPHEGKKCPG